MIHEYIQIDTYNNTASCRLNGISCIFPSASEFIQTTGFPFEVGLLNWEPSRAHWVVERPGTPPTIVSGSNLPEIIWLDDHKAALTEYCRQYVESLPKPPEITLRNVRDGTLYATDWVLQRRQEEQLLNLPLTLTEEKFQQVLVYRQALRNMTNTYSSLDNAVWPVNPLE
jgi:hypothetical protein